MLFQPLKHKRQTGKVPFVMGPTHILMDQLEREKWRIEQGGKQAPGVGVTVDGQSAFSAEGTSELRPE